MHIPDGYLGPQTYGALYGVMLPIWYWASRKVKEALKSRQAPLLALASAFSFIIMMFNVPAPGGSTGHAVGGALIAIVLGPWQALMAITVALVIQSLLFGDGGVTAIGANCFNMAFVMPFTAYFIYWLTRGNAAASSKRSLIAGFIAGYVSLNIAAILTAVEFGIQPFIARGADGAPLYCPYPLSVTVPVMAFEHLLVFGWIEGAVTSLVLSYIARTEPDLIAVGIRLKRLWIGLAFLIILTPLGLIAQGTAWGEWSAEELKKILGFIPQGLERIEGIWSAMFGDYNIPGWEGHLLSGLGYILSALIGVAVIAGAISILGRLLEEDRGQRTEDRSLPLQAVSRGQRGRSFLDKTLSGISGFLKDAIFTSEWVRQKGLLQGIEPKSKLIGILFFILTVSIVKEISTLFSLYVFSVILAAASSIGIIPFIRRVWLFIPLFAGFIAIPAIFITPGEPLLSFFGLIITKEGVNSAITFILRVAASVSFIVLLILTTKWDHIMKALRVFRIPAVFILILSMTYRYIYLLLSTVEDMYIALLSRTIKGHSRKEGQKWAAGRIGFLFHKSRRLSEDVYDAMVSRGFDGEVRVMDNFRMRSRDYIWLCFAFGIFIGVQIAQ